MNLITFTLIASAFFVVVFSLIYLLFSMRFNKKLDRIQKVETDKYALLDREYSILKTQQSEKTESNLQNEKRNEKYEC